MAESRVYDIAIIGGGINGAGIARDAAGRGLRVLLMEKGDLAQGTSSASSKLIHGGLRYLEHYEFRLVRESLKEREVLMGIAPHIIWPMDFILPHAPDMRPFWMLRAGMLLYDNLAQRRQLRASAAVPLAGHGVFGGPLQAQYLQGFRYTDCWVDDARLVVLNALDAAEHGADIRTRTTCTKAERMDGMWWLQMQTAQGETAHAKARILINAAGPWANGVAVIAGVQPKGRVRLVKGSHIVVPRVHDGNHAYILQMPDKRIIFVLPFEREFSLIGTTDVAYEGNPAEVAITQEEIRYLLDGVNHYLAAPLEREDVVWSYSGVRALYDDASENLSTMTRDYVLELDSAKGAPLLSVFGGKITTYRTLAEQALDKLALYLPRSMKGGWTGSRPLPGGESYSPPAWLDRPLAMRWARQYGNRAARIIGAADDMAGLGEEIAPGVFEAELHYAKDWEWARTADDFLWRRTKLGLTLSSEARLRVIEWFENAR